MNHCPYWNNAVYKYQHTCFPVINITDDEINKCKEFALMRKTNGDYEKYKDRGQEDLETIEEQDIIGKIGEIVSYRTFKEKLPGISYPDFQYYSSKEKGYGFDLFHGDSGFAIKSCSRETICSWVVQKKDKNNSRGRDRELYDNSSMSNFFVGVMYNVFLRQGIVAYIAPVPVTRKLFMSPQKSHLQDIKEVFYWSSAIFNHLTPFHIVTEDKIDSMPRPIFQWAKELYEEKYNSVSIKRVAAV